MTDPEKLTKDEELCRLVEGFIDGELVTCDALRNALAEPAARDHLVDLLILRRAVGTMAPIAWSTTGRPRVVRTRAGWLTTAAAILVSLAAGYLTGQRAFTPAVAAQTVHAVAQADSPPAAPKPTRVIRLEPGINWIENSGGR